MKQKTEQTYTVTISFQFPAWDERDGITYSVEAASKSDAIAKVRRTARNDGHIGNVVGKGRVTFRAVADSTNI